MPKAPVNEDCYAFAAENEIWLSRKVDVSAPAGESGVAQEPEKRFLRCCVPLRADARHVARALFSRKPIRHCFLYFVSGGLIFPMFLFQPIDKIKLILDCSAADLLEHLDAADFGQRNLL